MKGPRQMGASTTSGASDAVPVVALAVGLLAVHGYNSAALLTSFSTCVPSKVSGSASRHALVASESERSCRRMEGSSEAVVGTTCGDSCFKSISAALALSLRSALSLTETLHRLEDRGDKYVRKRSATSVTVIASRALHFLMPGRKSGQQFIYGHV